MTLVLVPMGALPALLGSVALLLARRRPGAYGGGPAAVVAIACGLAPTLVLPVMRLFYQANWSMERRIDAAKESHDLERSCGDLIRAFREGDDGEKYGPRRVPPPACLCHFIATEDDHFVRWMIDHGADPNASCSHGHAAETTLLDEAVARPALAEHLLAHGADPNRSGADCPPLARAVGGDVAVVRGLLEHGARPDARCWGQGQKGDTALHSAMLPHNTARPLSQPTDDPEQAALKLAAARLLLEHGASPAVQNAQRETPLHVAVRSGFLEGVELLLEQCAQRPCTPPPQDIADGGGATPLHLSMNVGDSQQARARSAAIAAALLRYGADPVAQDKQGETPLHRAARSGFVEGAELLLARCRTEPCARSPVGVRNSAGETPLHLDGRATHRDARVSARAGLWRQPEGQRFETGDGRVGGRLAMALELPVSRRLSSLLGVEGKTAGWVAGNPYLDGNVSLRAGLVAALF